MDLIMKLISSISGFNVVLMAIEILCCLGMPHRKKFWPYFLVLTGAYAVLLNPTFFFAFYEMMFQWFGLSYVIVYVISCLILYSGFRIKLSQAFYVGAIAYSTEHFIYQLSYLWSAQSLQQTGILLSEILTQVAVVSMIFLVYFFCIKKTFRSPEDLLSNDLFNIAISLVTIFVVCFMSYMSIQKNAGGPTIIVYRMLSSGELFFFLIIFPRMYHTEKENGIMQNILRLSEKQHQKANENVENINRICHDLKYQLAALRMMEDPVAR